MVLLIVEGYLIFCYSIIEICLITVDPVMFDPPLHWSELLVHRQLWFSAQTLREALYAPKLIQVIANLSMACKATQWASMITHVFQLTSGESGDLIWLKWSQCGTVNFTILVPIYSWKCITDTPAPRLTFGLERTCEKTYFAVVKPIVSLKIVSLT